MTLLPHPAPGRSQAAAPSAASSALPCTSQTAQQRRRHHGSGPQRLPASTAPQPRLYFSSPPLSRQVRAAASEAAEAAIREIEDPSIRVKLMLAEGSGRLDLSECELAQVPAAVFMLEGLEELSLAGNPITELPPEVGRLSSLKRLQLAGCSLSQLPDSVSCLGELEGLWLHGNRLSSLPESITALGRLSQLSLAGNCLQALPEGLGAMTALRELGLAGNSLGSLPESVGSLAALTKLQLHGNQLAAVPPSVSGLQALEELWLQGNPQLRELPAELGQLGALKHFSAADCALESVPPELGALPSLQSLSLYGNRLQEVAPSVLQAPHLKHVWLEANPLSPAATAALLQAAPGAPALSALGLDESQLLGAPAAAREAAGKRLRPCRIHGGRGPGYFKLEGWGGEGQASVLVVSFGSAPGTPNWGGVLAKVRGAATQPEHAHFDVLYVVDPHRSWYRGGDEGYHAYVDRLEELTKQYQHVVFIGDSMGATGALLFSHLASAVHAFCPQVDLDTSSIRPGQPSDWFAALHGRVLANVGASAAKITVHVGNWKHDLDQACMLPPEHAHTKIYSADTHRLALLLDKRGKLQEIVRRAVLQEMGLKSGHVRLANLV